MLGGGGGGGGKGERKILNVRMLLSLIICVRLH